MSTEGGRWCNGTNTDVDTDRDTNTNTDELE